MGREGTENSFQQGLYRVARIYKKCKEGCHNLHMMYHEEKSDKGWRFLKGTLRHTEKYNTEL